MFLNNPNESEVSKIMNENKEIKNSIMENTKKYKEDLRVELLEDVNSEVADLVKKEEKHT